MGWPWTSSNPDKASEQASDTSQQRQSITGEGPSDQVPSTSSEQNDRDRRDEQELKELWRQLSDPSDTSSSSSSSATTTATGQSDLNSHNLYPTEMSCRSAFDYAFFCQSFGGQWVNVYRYGNLRSCSEHWSDFWFCMRTNSMPEKERRDAIQDRYRRKAIKYKTGPSSEDIWDVRTEPAKGAFQGDFVAFEKRVKELEEQEKRTADHASSNLEHAPTTS